MSVSGWDIEDRRLFALITTPDLCLDLLSSQKGLLDHELVEPVTVLDRRHTANRS